MIKISLILPYRDQYALLAQLIDSIMVTTADLSSIEMVLAVDNDDEVMKKNSGIYERIYPFMKFHFTEKSDHFVRDYFNFAASRATGRYIICINADSIFKTKDWDTFVYEAMDRASKTDGDDIHLGLIRDGINRHHEDPLYPNFTSWVTVSKQSVDSLGYLYYEKYKMWGVDHFIADVYKKIGRLVTLTHVFIDHCNIHTGQRPADENHAKFGIISESNEEVTQSDVESEAGKLLVEIERARNARV